MTSPLTGVRREEALEVMCRSREAQGLSPDRIVDPVALDRMAVLLKDAHRAEPGAEAS